jgi:hypothetical protein
MKKIITCNFVILMLSLFVSGFVSAQDPVIGKYEFTGGSPLPSYEADGVTFGSEFAIWNTQPTYPASIVFDEVNGYMNVRNTGKNVSQQRYGYFSITPDLGKTVQITKVEVLHKEGNTNTANTRCYLYDSIKDAPLILDNLIYVGTGGFTIPSDWTRSSFVPKTSGKVAFDVQRFMSLTVTQTNLDYVNPAEWLVDELIFYGTVYTEGEVIIPSSLEFGDNNTLNLAVDKTIDLKGVNTVGGVTLSIEGADASLFTLSQSSFTETEINAGVIVTVTYTPNSVDVHTASIKVSYAAADKYISISGAVPILYETFDTHDMTSLVDKSPLTNLSDYTVSPGWITENVTQWHKSGTYGFAPALISRVDTVASYSTPELDLSTPFKLTFLAKRLNNEDNGESYMLVDQDTIFAINNTVISFKAVSVDGYIAGSSSRIKFTGKGVASNKVAFDNIRVSYTNSPALNLPYSSLKNFENQLPGVSSTIDIPIIAYNLSGDLSVSVPTNSAFELLSGTTITKAAAEAGTNIQVEFTPSAYESYSDKITVSGGGLLLNGLSSDRTVYLTGVGSLSTGTENIKSICKISVEGQLLKTSVIGSASMEVYSFTGHLLVRKDFTDNTEINLVQGAYLVRVIDSKGITVQKVLVN